MGSLQIDERTPKNCLSFSIVAGLPFRGLLCAVRGAEIRFWKTGNNINWVLGT